MSTNEAKPARPADVALGSWFIKQFETLTEARRRERQIKSWKSHRSIQELIEQKRGS